MPKVSKKNKNTQREALLSLIYQQELFEHVDEEDTGESKEFREFITEEAKERGVDSLELIDYFAENREELTEVLKKKNYDKFIPRLDKIYSPAGTFNIYQKVTTQHKLTKNDLKSQSEESLIYQKGDLSYFYPIAKLDKLEGDVPKVYISQDTMPIKVINLLTKCGIGSEILDRPKECYRVLKEFLLYFNTHYEPIPEIESFNLYNDFHKTETVKLPLSISDAFKEYTYEDFKDLLIAI